MCFKVLNVCEPEELLNTNNKLNYNERFHYNPDT